MSESLYIQKAFDCMALVVWWSEKKYHENLQFTLKLNFNISIFQQTNQLNNQPRPQRNKLYIREE